MNWYIVLAHPNSASLNHRVCQAFIQGLEQAGAAWELNDLYASGFNPVMAGSDFNQFTGDGPLPADVLAEQARLGRSDALALIYPVWWNEAPAMLKGWIDRVLSKGFAYDVTAEGAFQPLLKLKKLLILNTADNPAELLESSGLNAAARLTKAEGTFRFCGASQIEHRILGAVSSDEAGRKRFLEEATRCGNQG
jgi:NAD(P)H dehydrogenase (quinone)